MAVERTLCIVKPDATASPAPMGEILRRVEEAGLRIVAVKMLRLSEEQARGFYAVHKARPFYGDLVKFMTSGPVVVAVLEGENAVARWRELHRAHGLGQGADGDDARRLRHRRRAQRRPRLRRRGDGAASRSPTSSTPPRSPAPSRRCRTRRISR